MNDRTGIYLKDLATGEPVAAVLIDGITIRQVVVTEVRWRPYIENKEKQLAQDRVPHENWPQHLHWDWTRKYKKTRKLLAYRWLGIECAEEMQGLMLLDTATVTGRLPDQQGRPLVYVHYVATAPWNSPEVTHSPKYGWIGRVFIAAAIQISRAEGYKGRLGLHALPQSETYYREICGMTDWGKDPSKENLRYFEMTPQQAENFLEC